MRATFSLFTLLAVFSMFLVACGNNSQGGMQPFDPNAPQPPKEYKVLTLSPRKARVNFDYPATIQGQ